MNWHEIRLDDVSATPWRNGGGTTRELLAWPRKDDWHVRASVAQIARAGPFSAYPGVTRWFSVLSGQGVNLRIAGKERRIAKGDDPLRFDGAEAVDCELAGGPTEDFNLMLRGREGSLRRIAGRNEIACRKGSLVGVYSHEHEIAFMAVEVRIVVPPRTLAWNVVPVDERVDLSTPGALWFEVLP
jgi:environmental stress-induced protein Ves